VQSLLAQTANPEVPNEVNVSQPSDVLTARAAAAGAFDSLFLGLGVVALIVGAVGVANIMIISVSNVSAERSPCARALAVSVCGAPGHLRRLGVADVLHVLDAGPVLEHEARPEDALNGLPRPKDHLVSRGHQRLQGPLWHAVAEVHLFAERTRHGTVVFEPQELQALRVLAGIGHPDSRGLEEGLAGLNIRGRDTDVVELQA
jgi:hypothetical protein